MAGIDGRRVGPAGDLAIVTLHEGPVVTVFCRGEVDVATAPYLFDQAMTAVRDPSTLTVVLDLGEVTFLDSSGVSCLIRLQRACGEVTSFALRQVPAKVRKVLLLCGLGEAFREVATNLEVAPPVDPGDGSAPPRIRLA